jgi:hypothetical protein
MPSQATIRKHNAVSEVPLSFPSSSGSALPDKPMPKNPNHCLQPQIFSVSCYGTSDVLVSSMEDTREFEQSQ